MKKYRVSFKETLERIVIVEAETEEEAQDIAEDMYYNEEVVLDSGDFQGTKIDVLCED